jgi:hypothetical protein
MSGLRFSVIAFIALTFMLVGCTSRQANGPRTIQISAESKNAAEPATTSFPDGRVAVAWVEHGENTADVMFQVFDRQGISTANTVRVNPTAGEAKAWRGDPPQVTASNDGSIYVSWTAAIPDDKGTTLYVSASRDGGRTFEQPVKVNDDSMPASHGMHSMTVDSRGNLYAAWLDERYLATARKPEMHHDMAMAEPNAELYFAMSTDGGRSFSANHRIAQEACPCCKTAVTADDNGYVFVGFRQVLPGGFRHIAVVPSTNGGSDFGHPTVVANDSWRIDACPVSGPSLELKNGSLNVVWFAGGEARAKGVYLTQSHDLNSLTFSEPQLVAETISAGTPVLSNDRVVWSELRKLRTAEITENRIAQIADLGEGSVPVVTNDRTAAFVVFTRSENDRSSVMLTILPYKLST